MSSCIGLPKSSSTLCQFFEVRDERGGKIKGALYESELSRVRGENRMLSIDKVIKVKGNKALVRWLGYDKSYDSWVDKSSIKTSL